MSHTNHRLGSEESLQNDFPILALGAKDITRDGCAPKLQRVKEIFLRHNPVNVTGPEKEIKDNNVVHAVFDSEEDLISCMKELKEADTGVSITVSGLFDKVHECCREAGITPHTVNTSLGIWGNIEEKLPKDSRIAEITTMCGHGMVTFALVTDIAEKIHKGKLTPEKGAEILAGPCTCRIFNTKRAIHILKSFVE